MLLPKIAGRRTSARALMASKPNAIGMTANAARLDRQRPAGLSDFIALLIV
jgi:hypothetical protein